MGCSISGMGGVNRVVLFNGTLTNGSGSIGTLVSWRDTLAKYDFVSFNKLQVSSSRSYASALVDAKALSDYLQDYIDNASSYGGIFAIPVSGSTAQTNHLYLFSYADGNLYIQCGAQQSSNPTATVKIYGIKIV